jgi:hypothetical protein
MRLQPTPNTGFNADRFFRRCSGEAQLTYAINRPKRASRTGTTGPSASPLQSPATDSLEIVQHL